MFTRPTLEEIYILIAREMEISAGSQCDHYYSTRLRVHCNNVGTNYGIDQLDDSIPRRTGQSDFYNANPLCILRFFFLDVYPQGLKAMCPA